MQDGGMKAGTFDAYPSHSADPYHVRMYGSRDMSSAGQTGRYFVPPAGPKSAPSASILDQNIVRSFMLSLTRCFRFRQIGSKFINLHINDIMHTGYTVHAISDFSVRV